MHASALGKAILAFAPAELLDDLLAEAPPKLTSRTLTPAALRKELAATRESGIARERDEAVLGESSVAGAIFDHSGHAVGSIGVVGDTERILPRGPARGHRRARWPRRRAACPASWAPGAGPRLRSLA